MKVTIHSTIKESEVLRLIKSRKEQNKGVRFTGPPKSKVEVYWVNPIEDFVRR